MSVYEMIQRLTALGYSVKYRKRSDGGYLITNINGQKFELAKGNTFARQILNEQLSERRERQLQSIKPPKKKTPKQRRIIETLDEAMLKELRKVQKIWRKTKVPSDGRVSRRGLRKILEREGPQGVWNALRRTKAYAEGYAYPESVDALTDRLRGWLNASAIPEDWNDLIDYIDSHRYTFREEWITPIYEIMYDLERDYQNYIHNDDADSAPDEWKAIDEINSIIGR